MYYILQQKSRQQPLMQHQSDKKPHKSTIRYRITTGSGDRGGSANGATIKRSTFCVRRPLNGNNDYIVPTNQQPSGGSTVKTPRTTVTVTGETVFASGNNRNFSKNINNCNNPSATATESQRKRQHSPEEESAETNGVVCGTQFDIDENTLNFSQVFSTPISAKTGPKSSISPSIEDSIAERKKFPEIQRQRNEYSATVKSTPTASSPLLKFTKANNNPLLPVNLLNLAASLTTTQIPLTPTISTAGAANTTQTAFGGGGLNVESILLQRLQLIKHFLNLTAPAVSGLNQRLQRQNEEISATARASCLATQRVLPKALMVYENRPGSMEREVVVNSASLEDVALSELSDNRAQSIQSLNSVETPTPDTTPSFDELQQRLETSNRNIQNMQEQQQQLLRLQNAAKQHLSEMEHLRQQAGTLSFGANQANASNNGDSAPEYESIDQVHSDMATLVGRMKNLTTFIQNQNELSNLLGDDGPEILAEQEALQRKLESLRAQRDDMRTLVGELQEINRTAERRVGADSKENAQIADNQQSTTGAVLAQAREESPPANAARVVPVAYTRNVPIQLTNGSMPHLIGNVTADEDNDDPAEKAATAVLIQQKVADIETMRKQLQRLKDMMETVNMIEARTSRDVNDIGRTPPREMRSQSRTTGSSGASFDRECTPVSVVPAHHSSGAEGADDDSYLTRKMRMINDVTSDLRAQAESLQAERDRIKALKEEIVLRKQQAAAAAQLGEDALKRSSLTPTPTPRSRKQRELDTPSPPPLTKTENERDQLKMEYETKKREFELLCQRLQQDDTTTQSQPTSSSNNAPLRRDTVSEADDEADGDEELIDSDFATTNTATAARQYFTAPQQQSTPAQQHRAAVKAAVTAHTQATGVASAKVNAQHRQSQGQHLPIGALGKEDSFEMNQTSSTGVERRHSTLANATNITQDGASLEAGSVQSGSSQSAFSMPPPMPAMGPCSSWPPMPPMPNTWNPQLYYGFGATAPPQQPNASQPNSATTTQSVGAPFTPVGLLPQSTVNSECICSAANSATTAQIVTGPTPTSSSTNTAAQLATDPVLLQQFVQTQQMLINSVCQCNQMLWHQQREIDALNNTIHVLQDRLLALTSGVNAVPLAADMPYTIRAESVPPPSLTAGTLPNNLYLSNSNRAQSEQPALFLPGMTTAARNSAFSNYQHHQQQYQQRQQRGHIASAAGGVTASNSYNFNSESQQHSNIASATSANAGLYSTLNNAAPPPPPPNQAAQSHYNNEVPQSPPLHGNAAGPGPIFMHHHNNAIHQNNANLRTQNHYANNLHQQQQQQQQQQQHGHSNINIGGGNTLNNQVPPGNRANNYWDNFRSYSRQNLLSTNSNKSNEEQQQQNQLQQQQQHQHQHYVQQRLLEQLDTPAPSHYRAQQQPHHRSTTALPTAAALTTSNLQQLQRQQRQQEEAAQQQQRSTQTQPQLFRSLGDSNSNNCNNLNFERNANDNKYMRTLQRSHINRYQQQQQQNLGLTNSLYTNHNNLYQSWLPEANNDTNNVDIDVYDAYNIIDSDLAAPYAHLSSNMCTNSSNMLRNMNVNFGNSPHYQRNKLLTKPSCRGTAAEAMEQHNPNRAPQSQQQQQQQQHQQMLSQQQLALCAQQQLDQSTLRPMRNMPAYTQARYLDLLPATVREAVASTEVQLRNRDRVDMLLRTVTADDEEDVGALAAPGVGNNTAYNAGYMPTANETLLMDSNEIGNNTPNIDHENSNEPDGVDAALNADANEAHDEEEDDDTTSEEIKRNLLVNALKNDKFTTKFYESIKEDVFRRLERMLLEKESAESNCQRGAEQIRNGFAAVSGVANITNATIDGPNDMLGAASLPRDPTRKFNLNARMGNKQQQHQYRHQQQQHQQQHQHNSCAPPANAYQIKQEEASNDHAAEDDQHVLASAEGETDENNRRTVAGDNAEEDEYGVNNADTESNKADNEDAAAAAAAAVALANTASVARMPGAIQLRENEQPEEDNVHYNDNSNNVVAGDAAVARQAQPPESAQQRQLSGKDGREAEGNITNWLQNVFSQAESTASNISTSNIGKKRKNQLEAMNNSGAGGDAEAMSSSVSANNSAENNLSPTHYTDLIAYIITRIRNQTHPNTQINDTILVEIAKLTASTVQNFAPTLGNYQSLGTSSPHISPKKFYMKIKKLSVPRQRDEFLTWYENYLENHFPGARLEAERRREELRSSGISGAAPIGLELPRMCDKLENHHQQVQLRQAQQHKQQQQARNASNNDHKDNSDADLAEADQNSANSSSNTTIEERHDGIIQRENELENNENPDDGVKGVGTGTCNKHDEHDDAGAVGGAYAIMPIMSVGNAAAAAAAATVTDDTITAALQEHVLLRYASDSTAAGGTPANDFTPHNGYT
ncbi:uncharacterized protein LOC118739158 isoform X1 [Rhagoletis pomonella]|uniref:uncharacterized protein LOC118739158 isoform X1 n=1 Tax=Rhagoletis pomonella TaxID=28610 RepID=UPI00177F2089|nr:uncharacterized protein LOC118739158 isoform X1 [Rhagoletis pomonella]